jgi:hypothetical protein
MDIKKAKTIVKAFTSELPVGEPWYEERLEICRTCPLNSDNVDPEKLSFASKLMIKSKQAVAGAHCTACGCFIKQKCSVKSETCGRYEIGERPLWEALEVESTDGNATLEVLNSSGKIKYAGKEFLFDFGTNSDNVLNAYFEVKSKEKMTYSKFTVGCGCTHPEKIEQKDDYTLNVHTKISTLGFRPGLNEKTLTIEYKTAKGSYKNVLIRFRVIKL